MGFRVGRSSGRRARRHAMGWGARAVGLITLLCSVVVMTPLRSVPVAAGSPGRPNVVVVMTDDMSTAELEHLPHVQELLVRQGRTFDEYAVSVPVCCPSRVTMLRGQYAHNTGVHSNEGTAGGFSVVHDEGLESSTVATWLRDAGYEINADGG